MTLLLDKAQEVVTLAKRAALTVAQEDKDRLYETARPLAELLDAQEPGTADAAKADLALRIARAALERGEPFRGEV